jgi:hypothetical protein
MVLANLVAASGSSVYAAILALHLLFYGMALAGVRLHHRRLPRLICLPYYFCLTNAASAGGFWRWWMRSQPVTWAQADRSPSVG